MKLSISLALIFGLLFMGSCTGQQQTGQSKVGQIDSNSIEDQNKFDVSQKRQLVTTSSPSDVDYDDDDDDDEDDDEDSGENNKQADVAKETTTEKTLKASMKVCVTLSPAHASTRNGPFVSFECAARLCSDQDDWQEDSTKFPVDMYRFRRPIFDWNSQFAHLLLVNGTCDSSMLNCWHKIDVNVDSLTDAMEMDGVERIEIRCAVADYVRSFDAMNYVFGESTSVLKYFRGNRAHEPCNTTEDCGDNLICSQNDDNSLLSEDNSSGFCECPSEQMISMSAPTGPATTMRSFILVEDPHYLEQVCVPVRMFNETCQYDQQCKGVDANLACRAAVTEDGVTSSVSFCACAEGFQRSVGYAPRAKCLAITPIQDDSNDLADQDKASSAGAEEESSSEATTSSNEFVDIWWIFPPSLDESSQSIESSSRKSSHGLLYYGSRIFNLASLAYLLMLLAILMPLVIIGITLLFYCHRRMSQTRQYQARRTSFTDSIYYPDNMPSTPSEKTKSVTFGFGPTETVTPPSSPSHFKKSRSNKKTTEDKLDLVDNDQLEQVHRFP